MGGLWEGGVSIRTNNELATGNAVERNNELAQSFSKHSNDLFFLVALPFFFPRHLYCCSCSIV
jgi:hypothetical protein